MTSSIVLLEIFGFEMFGLEMFGLAVSGFEMFGFGVLGLLMLGLEMFGFEILGLLMFGFEMFGSVTSAFEILGFEILGFEMLGLEIFGLEMSGFRTAEALRPFVTTDPPIALIWATFTVTLACGLVEVTNTLRDTEEYCGMVTSRVVNCENCRNDAEPPVG